MRAWDGRSHLQRENLAGRRFGRLTAICPSGRLGKMTAWTCECECGEFLSVRASAMKSGNTRSCGCFKAERMRELGPTRGTHGLYRTTENTIWNGIVQRCTNPNAHDYPNYGGRGITVCDRWREFTNFLADMGARPEGKSIDRIDNDGGYEPGNCRWATRREQALNQRPRIRNELGRFTTEKVAA